MLTRFPAHTPESALGSAHELLAGVIGAGSAGPMVRTMAGSPSVRGGYLDLSTAMKRSRVDRAVSERISLAVPSRWGCELCLAAHTDGARRAGVSDTELATRGTCSVPSVAAIAAFASRVHAEPASVTADDALNVLTGSFNLVAGLEPAPELATTA
jgi:AhpD family alkylhydroperoxidase